MIEYYIYDIYMPIINDQYISYMIISYIWYISVIDYIFKYNAY
jgi:hypothetical protein